MKGNLRIFMSESIWKQAWLEQARAAKTKDAYAFLLQMVLVLFWKVQGDKKKSLTTEWVWFHLHIQPGIFLKEDYLQNAALMCRDPALMPDHQSNCTRWTRPHPAK